MLKYEKLDELKVSRDPILGYINIEYKVIWDLINTKEMQRLRRIHQLGGTHQVFASSEHSRFTHSLGTYENARKIVETVEDIRNLLTEEEKVTILCAALLHDVGHGPFSHGFESIHPIHHELYSIAIIEKDSDVNKVLKNISEELPFLVSSVLKKTHPNPILSQLLIGILN
jgi:HD superfamily phosphohydrolase